ncbi:hypothetical protein RvY_09079 [Ramazzottius varieornatus]|uniref:Uncharacterized protein n=1 Tax=Ramazzottius varieornatus TaxID=947166 RepID=A0A1D1VAD2_RAMVA|nr:hypothetical protein RvY_09079 [Ramazzottius varieornatus]
MLTLPFTKRNLGGQSFKIVRWTVPESVMSVTSMNFSTPAPKMEIRAPVVHYILSGPLTFSFRFLNEPTTPQSFIISLIPMNTNATLKRNELNVAVDVSSTSWKMMEFPCHLLVLPGRYALHASAHSNGKQILANAEVFVEVRWFQTINLFLLKNTIQPYKEELPVNVSLQTSIVCPQQQPPNLTLRVNLMYKQTEEAPTETVASRELAWPFGTMRSPHNTSISFGCQLLDRSGTYYATLAILLNPLLPDQSEITVATSPNTAIGAQLAVEDYGLVILGDLGYCATRNNRSRSIRVSYRAPECVANDKIRLYRIGKKRASGPAVEETFLMERSIQSRPRGVSFNFPCRILWTQRDQAAGFCWTYTSVTRGGQSSELEATRKCLQMSTVDKQLGGGVPQVSFLGRQTDGSSGTLPRWSEWSTWSPCTKTCNPAMNVSSAVRLRQRTCLRKTDNADHWFPNNNCLGSSIEIQICSVPRCSLDADGTQEITEQEGNAFLWPLGPDLEADANGSVMSNGMRNIIIFYNSPVDERLLSSEAMRTRELFRRCGLLVSGVLGLCLVLNILLPFLTHRVLQKPSRVPGKNLATVTPKNGDAVNRDSRCALMTSFHEEEVGVAAARVKEVAADVHLIVNNSGPSRSGVADIEMVTTSVNQNGKETPKVERGSKMYRSPLPKHRTYLEEVLASDTPRSSVSFRPEAGDADFEYDDFIPEKHEEEETDSGLWAPQRLDLTVFAQDYDDIVQELYAAKPS